MYNNKKDEEEMEETVGMPMMLCKIKANNFTLRQFTREDLEEDDDA